MTSITAIIVAVISLMGNLMQYIMNKKNSDVQTLNHELEYIKSVLKTQAEAYKIEQNLQEKKIKTLETKVASQGNTLKEYEDKITLMQGSIAKLIGNGCHTDNCAQRKPYTLEEINEVTKSNKKNEKVNIRAKK